MAQVIRLPVSSHNDRYQRIRLVETWEVTQDTKEVPFLTLCFKGQSSFVVDLIFRVHVVCLW